MKRKMKADKAGKGLGQVSKEKVKKNQGKGEKSLAKQVKSGLPKK